MNDKKKRTRHSQGRFTDHVGTLAKMISERYELPLRRCRKLIGQSLTDPRIMATIFEHVSRVVSGRGDGMTLIDLAENENLKRILKRANHQGSENHVEKTEKRSRKRSA